MNLTPACVWKCSTQLVIALQENLGDPLDSYVNGSQVWFTDFSDDVTIEWRLHPVAGYTRPDDMATDEVFSSVVFGSANSELGFANDDLGFANQFWCGLETFPAFGESIEPIELRNYSVSKLGIQPDGCGLVDHKYVGDSWEKAKGNVSIIDLLLKELET